MSEQPTNDGATQNEPTAKKDSATKLARKRLSVLELARELGSVAEACRRSGMDRTSFYEYKRRFQLQGLEGLKDLPPVAKSHPQTTSDDVVQQIVVLALEHPAWGCNRISDQLALFVERFQQTVGNEFFSVMLLAWLPASRQALNLGASRATSGTE
jgi:hypothetical protein